MCGGFCWIGCLERAPGAPRGGFWGSALSPYRAPTSWYLARLKLQGQAVSQATGSCPPSPPKSSSKVPSGFAWASLGIVGKQRELATEHQHLVLSTGEALQGQKGLEQVHAQKVEMGMVEASWQAKLMSPPTPCLASCRLLATQVPLTPCASVSFSVMASMMCAVAVGAMLMSIAVSSAAHMYVLGGIGIPDNHKQVLGLHISSDTHGQELGTQVSQTLTGR